MEMSTWLSAPEWNKQTFGEVHLGHRRERAVMMAAAIAHDPVASLSKLTECATRCTSQAKWLLTFLRCIHEFCNEGEHQHYRKPSKYCGLPVVCGRGKSVVE